MQVKNALTRIRSDVGDEAEAAFSNAQFTCYLCGGDEDAGEYGSVLGCDVGHRGDMAARDEQDVVWRLRVDVRKGDNILVRIHDFGGYLALDNLTEQAVLNSHGSTFPPQYASHPGLPRALL